MTRSALSVVTLTYTGPQPYGRLQLNTCRHHPFLPLRKAREESRGSGYSSPENCRTFSEPVEAFSCGKPRRRGDRRHCLRRSMMNDRAITDTVAAPTAADGATSKQFMTSGKARSYPRLDSHTLHHHGRQYRERSSGAALDYVKRLVPSIAEHMRLSRRCANATWLAARLLSPSAAALLASAGRSRES